MFQFGGDSINFGKFSEYSKFDRLTKTNLIDYHGKKNSKFKYNLWIYSQLTHKNIYEDI